MDMWAETAATKRKGFPPPVVFQPSPPFPAGYFIRNQLIVDYADVLIAFWDGKSRGTIDTLHKARRKWTGLCCIWLIEPHSYEWWAPAIQATLKQYARYGLPERRLLNA